MAIAGNSASRCRLGGAVLVIEPEDARGRHSKNRIRVMRRHLGSHENQGERHDSIGSFIVASRKIVAVVRDAVTIAVIG